MSNVRKRLRRRKERRARQELSTEELRALWQRGVESGPGRFASIDEIKKEARRRAAQALGEQAQAASCYGWNRLEGHLIDIWHSSRGTIRRGAAAGFH
jgi:hypothetical protein